MHILFAVFFNLRWFAQNETVSQTQTNTHSDKIDFQHFRRTLKR